MFKNFAIFLLCGFGVMWTSKAEAVEVRVALVQGQKTIALQADNSFEIHDLVSGATHSFSKGKYFAHVDGNNIKLEEQTLSNALELVALKDKSLPSINGRRYDGNVQLHLQKGTLLAVNRVELEQMLSRVLPQKTMPIWPDEAIKAQAVAARSYIMNAVHEPHGLGYDLTAVDDEITYLGLGQRVEKPAISKLIKATEGQYLADANGRPIYAVSTSSSGGKTETGKAALKKNFSYLQSVEDFDKDSPEYKWELRISPEYVHNLLEQNGFILGKLANVRLSTLENPGGDRSPSGRVEYIIWGGTLGSVKLSGKKMMELLNLNSSFFDVEVGTPAPEVLKVPIENSYGMEVGKKEIPIKVKEEKKQVWSNFVKSHHVITGSKDEKIIFHGYGKGHGAGLSAWGAKGMAGGEEPKSYKEILAHYYPGTYLVK